MLVGAFLEVHRVLQMESMFSSPDTEKPSHTHDRHTLPKNNSHGETCPTCWICSAHSQVKPDSPKCQGCGRCRPPSGVEGWTLCRGLDKRCRCVDLELASRKSNALTCLNMQLDAIGHWRFASPTKRFLGCRRSLVSDDVCFHRREGRAVVHAC